MKRDYIRGDPKLEVARAIAHEAHKDQFRDTGGPSIEHPELVCNLMDRFGGNDVQKAVALLHDVLEDGERYKNETKGEDPEKNYHLFLEDLINGLNARLKPVTKPEREKVREWAERVYEGVRQLTKSYYLYEGKRTSQVDLVKTIDEEFKPVKILDQAATVIGDILYSKAENREQLVKDRVFALKGMDVSRACSDPDPAHPDANANLAPYHDFYKRTFNRFRGYYKLAKNHNFSAAEMVRKSFNIEQSIVNSLNPTIQEEVKSERITQYSTPALRTPWWPFATRTPKIAQGLAHIKLSNSTGEVVSFGLIVTPENESPANTIATNLRTALESSMKRTVETGELLKNRGLEKYPNNLQVRDYKFSHPMMLGSFLRIARKKGAIDEQFEEQLAHRIRVRIKRRDDPRDRGRGR